MKTTFIITALFLCLLMRTFSQAKTTSGETLTINANNFSSDEGNALNF